jgi:hypothetical protein
MSISKGFIQTQKDFYFHVLRAKLSPNQKVILMFVNGKIREWPETRETLSKEMSLSYIAQGTGIDASHVSKYLKKLANKGHIAIHNPLNKKGSRIIQLLDNCNAMASIAIPNELTQKKAPSTMASIAIPTMASIAREENNEITTELDTTRENANTPLWQVLPPNQENIYKKGYQESENFPTPPDDDVIIDIDKIREEEKQPEVEAIETSSNCSSIIEDNLQTSKDSSFNSLSSIPSAKFTNTVVNSNLEETTDIKPVSPALVSAPAINPPVTVQNNPQVTYQAAPSKSTIGLEGKEISTLPIPRVTAPCPQFPQVRNNPSTRKKGDFSRIGDVMAGMMPAAPQNSPCSLPHMDYSFNVPGIPFVSTDNVIAGVTILKEKNLTNKDITAVLDRIVKAMNTNNVEEFKRSKYFLNSCSNEPAKELPPEKSLSEQERERTIERIYDSYQVGKIKYVLSNAGEKKRIIEMNRYNFVYMKDHCTPKGVFFKELPAQLLDEKYFVGDYETVSV